MGYRAEKEKIEKKIRIIRIVALCVAAVMVVGLCIFSAFIPPASWKYRVGKPKISQRADGEMRIHFLDVGQGDSILIELPDGKVALIDGGDTTDKAATAILRYMNALDIEVIDYLVVTHSDSDHCGSLVTLLQWKTVLNAYLPYANPEYTSATYVQFCQAAYEEGCQLQYASRKTSLQDDEGSYQLACLYPYFLDVDTDMAYWEEPESIIMWLEYQGVGTLFMADASVALEEALLRDDELGLLPFGVRLQDTDILKVGHHGSKYSTSPALLERCGVELAVISCGKYNPYGHPSDEVIDRLNTAGIKYYRTDEQGSVMVSISERGVSTYLIK